MTEEWKGLDSGLDQAKIALEHILDLLQEYVKQEQKKIDLVVKHIQNDT